MTMNERGHFGSSTRVEHNRDAFRQFLSTLPPGSPIAVESTGSWCWLIDEMEKAGHIPRLAGYAGTVPRVHSTKARRAFS